MSTLNLNVSANCAKSWDRTCSSTQKAIHFAKKWTRATLADRYKFLAVGVQLIDPLLQRNHAICLGMRRLKGGTHEQNVEAIEFCTERAFGISTKQIAHSRIADRAAKGISKSFELSEDLCGMHDVDKVGQSATGRLTRSKDKKVINPFTEGVLLLKKVHKQAVYFSKSPKRWENMMEVADRVRCVSVSCIVPYNDAT